MTYGRLPIQRTQPAPQCLVCTTPTRCGAPALHTKGPRCIGRPDGKDDCDCLNACGDDPWIESGRSMPCEHRRETQARIAAPTTAPAAVVGPSVTDAMTTDTQPLAPTDIDIDALWVGQQLTVPQLVQRRVIARAVLAKWGTPAPVGVEPIGHLYCGGSYGDELADWEIVADQCQCDKLNEHHGALGKEAKLPIYTTPQPTQTVPPVEWEPLTEGQIKDEASYHGFIGSTEMLVKFVRGIEAAHGITKGGQHGAE